MSRDLLCGLAFSLLLALTASARAATFSDVYDAALGGDMSKALALLDSLDASRWSAEDTTAADCLRRTFASPPQVEALPPTSKAILTAYRRYWQTSMLRRGSAKDAEAEELVTDESRWRGQSAVRLRAAAASLLKKNSALPRQRGAATTERFLDASAD